MIGGCGSKGRNSVYEDLSVPELPKVSGMLGQAPRMSAEHVSGLYLCCEPGEQAELQVDDMLPIAIETR